jgi:hypothetical protein
LVALQGVTKSKISEIHKISINFARLLLYQTGGYQDHGELATIMVDCTGM